jgi:hypothetical protein
MNSVFLKKLTTRGIAIMYGITVAFPPAGGKSKYVMIHMRNCKFYKIKKEKVLGSIFTIKMHKHFVKQ